MARAQSKAAYYLVDLSELPTDVKNDILEDAAAGGGDYGCRVVEEIHNGPARAALYGVYYGEDDEKWQKAKADFGISGSEVEDAEVIPVTPEDPAKEASLRQAAEEAANTEANRVRSLEEAEIAKIVEPEPEPVVVNKANKAK